MKNKVAVANRNRGLLLEFSISIAKSHAKLKQNIPLVLENAENELTPLMREVIHEEFQFFLSLCERLKCFNRRIHQLLKQHQTAQQLTRIQGVGPLIATYLVSCISDTTAFKNGRECAASLGFTPREYSTGGKQTMIGIGRNGNKYLRRILIEGVHSIINRKIPPTDRLYRWGYQLAETKHKNLAVMAIANKIIRISFAMIQSGEKYCYQ